MPHLALFSIWISFRSWLTHCQIATISGRHRSNDLLDHFERGLERLLRALAHRQHGLRIFHPEADSGVRGVELILVVVGQGGRQPHDSGHASLQPILERRYGARHLAIGQRIGGAAVVLCKLRDQQIFDLGALVAFKKSSARIPRY